MSRVTEPGLQVLDHAVEGIEPQPHPIIVLA